MPPTDLAPLPGLAAVAPLATAAGADPVLFARLWLGWQPHPGQARWLAARHAPTRVLVTGRRWGKDEVVAVEALWHAVTRPGCRQLFASVTLDQARIPWDLCLAHLRRQPLLAALLARPPREAPFPTLELANGSVLTARTTARGGVYIRGHRFDRAILTEADYLDARAITDAVQFTLADVGGELVLQTTPRAPGGHVHQLLQRARAGDPAVYAQTGASTENPHIDHAYLAALRAQLPAAAWAREVEGQYVAADGAVFAWPAIQAAYADAAWPLPEPPQPGRRYVAGWDLARDVDWTVGCVLDATASPWRLVAFERFQRQPWPAVAARIRAVHQQYACHATLLDATGVGAAVLDLVADCAQGLVFTPRAKADLIAHLQVLLEQSRLRFPFVAALVDELQAYTYADARLPTDCVMALALACWAAGPRRGVEFAPPLWR